MHQRAVCEPETDMHGIPQTDHIEDRPYRGQPSTLNSPLWPQLYNCRSFFFFAYSVAPLMEYIFSSVCKSDTEYVFAHVHSYRTTVGPVVAVQLPTW